MSSVGGHKGSSSILTFQSPARGSWIKLSELDLIELLDELCGGKGSWDLDELDLDELA